MSQKQRQFLKLFNTLHDEMQEALYDRKATFWEACLRLAKTNYTVKKYEVELDMIRNLRNILVHSTTNETYDIAEPSDLTLSIMEEITEKLMHPIRIKTFLKNVQHPEVTSFVQEDLLTDVLETIQQYHFSQFPIFGKTELIGMITDNGIANWVADHVKQGGFSFENVRIKDVLGFDEKKDDFIIFHQEEPLNEIVERLENKQMKNTASFVLITQKDTREIHKPEDIVGILTAWDIPDIYKMV